MPPRPPASRPCRRFVVSGDDRDALRAVLVVESLEGRAQPSATPLDPLPAAPLEWSALVRPTNEIICPAPAPNAAVIRHELILIDRDVPDRDALVRDLLATRVPGTAVEVVELTDGGVAEVSAVLSRYSGLDAVHIISHGQEGELHLGDDTLDDATLDRFASDLRGWGRSLNAGADLLLYGCDLAAGDDGRALADRVAALTGADVAASTDLTGGAALGGDWNLEYHTGSIETAALTDANWAHTLGTGLWVSTTAGTTSVPAVNGGTSWVSGDAVVLGDPNLSLGAGTTSGTLYKLGFNLDNFAADGQANLNGLHYVSRAVTVGGAHAFALQAGDLLISVAQTETLGGVTVNAADIALFRPTTPGDYTAGTFSVILQDPLGVPTRDFALVETPTVVGGVTLNPGDFLLTANTSSYNQNITRYQVTDAGPGTTSGTISTLIDGRSAGIGFNREIFGVELVQQITTIGGVTLFPGQLLLSLNGDERVGMNGLDVKQNDVFVLTVAASGIGTSSGFAAFLVHGSNIDLSGSNDVFDAISLGPEILNAPPAVNPDSYATNEDTPLSVGAATGVLANDTDPNGDPLTATLASGPTHGTVVLNPDGSFTYTPAADYFGLDSFTYTVSDGLGGTATGTATITVNAVNDPPTLDPIAGVTVAEDSGPQTVSLTGITAGGGESQTLSVTATSSDPALIPNPVVTYTSPNAAGTLTFTPSPNANGTATITVTVSDGVTTTTQTFTVTVTPVNDAPVAADDDYSTPTGTRLAVPAAGTLINDTDADGDVLTATLATGPQHGTLQLNPDGSFVYDPAPGFTGTDSFTYQAVDPSGSVSGAAVVTIHVTALPATPPTTTVPPGVPPPTPTDPAPAAPSPKPQPAPVPTQPALRLAPQADVSGSAGFPDVISTGGSTVASITPGNIGGAPNVGSATSPVVLFISGSSAGPELPAPEAKAPQPDVPAGGVKPPPDSSAPAPPQVTPVVPPGPSVAAPVAVATAPPPETPDAVAVAETIAPALDKVSRDIGADAEERAMTDAVVTTTVAATAGYVLLNTRAVSWLISALLARPAVWRRFDPIDVIYSWEREQELGKAKKAADEEDESLQSMVG